MAERLKGLADSPHALASDYDHYSWFMAVSRARQLLAIALEIKRTLSPKLTPGFVESMKTLQAAKGYYIIPRGETFPLSESVTAISLSYYLSRLP